MARRRGGKYAKTKVVAAVERRGYVLVRRGRHGDIYRHPATGVTIQIPRHTRIKEGLVDRIAKDAGFPQRQFKSEL